MSATISQEYLRRLAKDRRTPLVVLLAAVIIWRARAAHLTQRAQSLLHKKSLTPEELAKASQQLYTQEPDGTKVLLVPFRGEIKKVPIIPTPPATIAADAVHFPPVPQSHKPNVDAAFLRQLFSILRIAFPSLVSREAAIVALHSVFLVLRTVLSVGVAKLDGRIVRDLVSANGKGFLQGLGWWFAFAIPSTYTNSMVSPNVVVDGSCA